MSNDSNAASSQQPQIKPPLHKRRFTHLLRPLCPLLSIETGLPHPDFPQTMLHYHLLTDSQLDGLAHFYHQRTPGWYSMGYPMPVVARWWAPAEQELEEGEIDEMEDVRNILGTMNEKRSEKVAGIEEKRRRFGRFLGLRNCESSVGEGDMRREMEEWLASEVARREHRDRELESWRSKGHWVLLSAPRRSSASPNYAGNLAVYTVSTYSFESHKKTSEIKVLDISTGQSTLITNEEKTSEPNWLGYGNELLWLKSGEKNVTHLIIGSTHEAGKSYVAGVIPAPISDVKLKVLDENRVAIAVTGKARPDGSLYNPEDEPKSYSTAKVYDGLMVRHWDKYVSPNKNAIWHGVLQRAQPHITESKGRYSLGHLTNVLKGSRLESPIAPFGGLDNFDLGSKIIAFVAKDPDLNPATNTKSNLYFVTMDNSSYSEPQKVELDGFQGASTAPALSPKGNGVAFLQMKENGYESDKNRILLCDNLSKPSATLELLSSDDGKGMWDMSPGSITWSSDGKALFPVAGDKGTRRLFKLMISYGLESGEFPEPLTQSGSVGDVRSLGTDSVHLFLSSSNYIDNSIYSILDPTGSAKARVISSNSRNGSFFGLSQSQVSDIWFEGAEEKVHAWVMKPSNFSSEKTYPLAYLIHGGPQGAWIDAWSTRWNPAIFTEQGYVVIAPNPTGSVSYGQAFTDAIAESWGGLPYEDLVKGFDYIKQNLHYVDTGRSVALGASYGGYMMNWMQGHALAKAFKALVCHDGFLTMANQLSSDERYFPNHDLGGPYFTNHQEIWEKWNPARFTANWSTPMLVIHDELDYRVPISEGLAMFNVLQEKDIESRFLTFSDENHWVLKEENSLVWHTVVLNWINKFVGLPAYKEDKDQGFEVQN